MTQGEEGKTCRHVLEQEMDFAKFHYTTQDMLSALKISTFLLRLYWILCMLPVCLHWLLIPERIEYKIALLAYKVMNGMAPRYLGPFVRVADLPGRRALRSAVTNRLTVPAV